MDSSDAGVNPEAAVEVRRRAVLLSKWQRFSAGLVGLGMSVAGGFAVFETDNQAGSTALLLIGGVALLVSITGRVPDRIGKEGINYEPVDPAARAIENVLADESVSIDTRETIAAAVREELEAYRAVYGEVGANESVRSRALAHHADGVLFEADVRRAIELAATSDMAWATQELPDGRYVDAVIVPKGSGSSTFSESLVIEATVSEHLREKVRHDLQKLAASGNPGGFILVTTPRGGGVEREANRWFMEYSQRFGIPNAHISFFDGGPKSVTDLAETIRIAWSAITSEG